jgi:hypothetical protein
LEKKQLLPKEHLLDTGFIDAELIVKSQKDFGIELVGPVRQATSWQHQMPEAYDLSKFEIDWERKKVTCLQGKESSTWNPVTEAYGNTSIRVHFRYRDCSACKPIVFFVPSGVNCRPLSLHR